jgi:hypothetical protein
MVMIGTVARQFVPQDVPGSTGRWREPLPHTTSSGIRPVHPGAAFCGGVPAEPLGVLRWTRHQDVLPQTAVWTRSVRSQGGTSVVLRGCLTEPDSWGCSPRCAVATLSDTRDHSPDTATTRSPSLPVPARCVVCRSERNDVGCSHSNRCPLFPLLNASLRGWRDYYCDTVAGWRDCARYKVALTGKPVPITLLPNGKTPHFKFGVAPDRPGQGQTSRHALPAHPGSSLPETAAVFEPVPPQPRDPSPSTSVPPLLESPPAPSKRGWWARVADWMRGPA